MTDSTITALGSATAIDGTELVPVVQGGVTKKVAVKDLRPYKVYTALLNQSGTDAPVATVLENTIDQTLVWERFSIGQYRLSLPGSPTSGPFIVGKTFAFSGNGLNSPVKLGFNNNSSMGMPNDIGMVLRNYDSSLNPTDQLKNASIEIRVYN
jgi:hypothetical protein